jgi:ABC-type nitrate/sulfonate/bicarbonate transport system permease component
MVVGFSLAVVLAVLTGRTILGWICFFFLLLGLQKIPAIAMVHVFVQSRLGISLAMTISLASTVVMTFTWLVLHHRAETLNPREVFALRVAGLRGWRLAVYGLLPHFGSALGGAARLGMSISILMVVLGEWQGLWSDGTIWQYGLGVMISRSYDAIDSQARVLAGCVWLGILGVILDGIAKGALRLGRTILGVNLQR